jgi:hypothetical protein
MFKRLQEMIKIRFSTMQNLDLKIDYAAGSSKRPATHLKREVDRIQNENKDHILLVQVGGFYEIYGILTAYPRLRIIS